MFTSHTSDSELDLYKVIHRITIKFKFYIIVYFYVFLKCITLFIIQRKNKIETSKIFYDKFLLKLTN